MPIFIFDKNILDQLPAATDRRVTFIHNVLNLMQQQLTLLNTSLLVCNELTYPKPIVDHEMARKRCLETYKKALDR